MNPRILSAFLIILFLTACNGMIEVVLNIHLPISHPQPRQTRLPRSYRQRRQEPRLPCCPSQRARAPTFGHNLAPTQNMARIFLIGVNDNGQAGLPVGCGDSAIPVPVEFPPTAGVLKSALVALLSVKDQYYGQSGLYNALYQSRPARSIASALLTAKPAFT